MARVKGAMMTRKRRNKMLGLAKGYWGSKSRHFKMAKEQVMKSGRYAYAGRKQKKRDFRQLWITRISAACKAQRHELLHLYARPEAGRHRHEPQDALRDRHPRRRRFHRPVREGQGRPVSPVTGQCAPVRADGGFCMPGPGVKMWRSPRRPRMLDKKCGRPYNLY